MLQNVEWGEFKVEDIFDSENGNFDIQKSHINGMGDYVITSGVTDNGILGKTDIDAKVFKGNTLTVDMFGFAFYRPFKYKMVTHARVFALLPKFEISSNQGLFLASAFHFLPRKFGYENMCSWSKIKDGHLRLPIKDNQIDFNFMEDYIRELEADYIRELEAYLIASDLDDYELTSEEQNAIESLGNVEWGEFAYQEIFDRIEQGRRLTKYDQVSGDIPFVMAGVTNTGVVNYISNPRASFPANSITVDIFGNTFYRNYNYGAGDDTGVYWSQEQRYNELEMLFFAATMEKSLIKKFSYGEKLRSSRSFNLKMKLPVSDQAIDCNFMGTLIRAVQKLVIKDVVLYKNQRIEETKKLTKRS